MIPGISRWELLSVQKPARYLGHEWNQAKPKVDAALRVCLAYPDIYDLGMSNIALKVLYELLDKDPEIAVERVFSPWADFEALLRAKKIPLFALESKRPLTDFDVFGITFPYEMTYTNILNMLDLAGIPLLWHDRTKGPIIIGGGPSAANPLPMADFFDAILVGDGEEALPELCRFVLESKRKGVPRGIMIEGLGALEGYFVPAHPGPVRRRIFKGFSKSPPPLHPIVPAVESVHDRVPIELFRGCMQGCRFCNSGFYYRPKRERTPDHLNTWARAIMKNTGDESLGLVSLSTSDYKCLNVLIETLEANKVFPEMTLSVPSLRMTEKTSEMLKKSTTIKKSGLTFAPEAGSQRLRDIIQKRISEEDILKVVSETREAVYRSVKLYFMIGLPFETDTDVDAIVDLIDKMGKAARKTGLRKEITVSLSGFIPKPHTPFQWAPQISTTELQERRLRVCRGLKKMGIKITWRDEFLCLLEGVLSRGDQRVGKLLLAAFRNGCKLDGWTEHFKRAGWEKAFAETGINEADYTGEKNPADPLPWDFIDFRVPRPFLEAEYLRAAELAKAQPPVSSETKKTL